MAAKDIRGAQRRARAPTLLQREWRRISHVGPMAKPAEALGGQGRTTRTNWRRRQSRRRLAARYCSLFITRRMAPNLSPFSQLSSGATPAMPLAPRSPDHRPDDSRSYRRDHSKESGGMVQTRPACQPDQRSFGHLPRPGECFTPTHSSGKKGGRGKQRDLYVARGLSADNRRDPEIEAQI